MSRALTIACLQTRPRPDFTTALEDALSLAEIAVGDGAQLLALPEYCGGLQTRGARFMPPTASQNEHPVLAGLCKFAAANNIWIVVGSVAIAGPDGKFYDRCFVINQNGVIVSHYDKIHLFDIQISENEVYEESAVVIPGDKARLTKTPFGILGHSICYDLRFPGLYRQLAKAGAEILMVPAAFTVTTGAAHWHVLNRARAIENGAFVVAPCAVGPIDGGGASYGHSLIVDPWGKVLADGGDHAGIALATIDLDQVAKMRAKVPSLAHDRAATVSNKYQGDVS